MVKEARRSATNTKVALGIVKFCAVGRSKCDIEDPIMEVPSSLHVAVVCSSARLAGGGSFASRQEQRASCNSDNYRRR
jgi:hypothetical protein